jgi:hypothetical protein
MYYDDLERGNLAWVAPTHTHTERTTDWYWALGLGTLIGIGLSIWLGNVLLALIIAVSALCLFLIVSRYPRHHEIVLMPEGIYVDGEYYPFESIHSFWVHEDHPVHPKLYLATRSILHPHIALIIEEPAEPDHVRDYLIQYVPESRGHTIATYVAEVMGF